jgi:L-lysine 6-transaminase
MDSNQVIPVLSQSILVDGFHIVLDLEKSKGSFMHNALTGKDVLDCYSMFASLPIGFNHPKMVGDAQFMKKLQTAALTSVANSDIYTKEYAEFVDTFKKLAVPSEYKHLFFVAGGALAVENALKTAFDWKTRLNFKKGKCTQADKVIHLTNAFHGRSGYTMSLTNTDPMKTAFFPKFNWEDLRIYLSKHSTTQYAEQEIMKIINKHKDSIAAFIFEPIQGEGGDNEINEYALEAIKYICDKHDIMFIADEVQTGFGLTGKMWASYSDLIKPDIIVFGKKAQVCGIMVNDKVDMVKDNVFEMGSRINSTWGGNLVDMVRCQKILEIIHEENLVKNSREVGEFFKQGLIKTIGRHVDIVKNIRGKGLMIAFTLKDKRDEFRQKCWENGVAVLPCGPNSIRLRPSLNLTKEEASLGVDRINKTFYEIFNI